MNSSLSQMQTKMSTSSLVRPGLTTAIAGHLPAIKLRLRRKVPILTFQDVRQARIPFYEALASELYENGCPNSAFLLLQLIEYEHDCVPPTSNPKIEEKRLKNSKKLLKFLTESLRDAEAHKNGQRYAEEIEHLLMIGRSFQEDRQRRWISRQFFLISLDRCAECQLEKSWVGTKAKYHYGMFLNIDGNFDEALENLETAENWARGKNWTLEKETPSIGSKMLIDAIYHQLYLVYSGMSDRFKSTNAEKFDQFMRLSHEAAKKCYLKPIMCDSFLNFGDFQLDQGRYHEALDCYKQSLRYGKIVKDTHKECKIHIRIAAVYRSLNDLKECEFWISAVDKMTSSDRNSECYAELRMFYGEIHFANGSQKKALDAFHEARDVYRHLRKEIKMIQASCFAALIVGDIHFGQFVELVRKAESQGPISENENLFKLLRWNLDNEQFW